MYRQPLRGLDEQFLQKSAEVYFEETFSHLSNVMLTYLLTGEERYAEVARNWLRELCRYPTRPGNQYAFGPYIVTLAQGYDWLADQLPAEERAAIRDQLISLVREAYECSFSAERAWWHGAYLHHDFWIPTAGYGIGALAVRDDVPEAQQWVDRAAAELGYALDLLGADGAWHEGAADWTYALVLFLLFADASRRAGGPSLYERPWLKETWRYRLYCWLPDNSYVYLNDSFRSGRYNILGSASSHVLRKLAAEYGNGYMQWLADRDEAFDRAPEHPGVYRSPYDWTINQPYSSSWMHCLAWNFLWFDSSLPARAPDDLPTAHHFPNQGVVVARTDWGVDASVVTFSCGPIGGHTVHARIAQGERRLTHGMTHVHAQATAFTLFAHGRYFIVPPGYGKHASRFQNVVAVNGSGQLWDPGHAGTIAATEFGHDLDYVLGDATHCYPEEFGIREHRRHLVFLKPDYLIICDVVTAHQQAPRAAQHYAWQLHTNPEEVEVAWQPAGLTLWARDDSARLGAHVLLPEFFGRASTQFAAANGEPLLNQAAIIANFQLPLQTVFVVTFALTERALAVPVQRIVGECCVGVALGNADELRTVLFAREPEIEELCFQIEPARTGQHVVVGLAPDSNYDVVAALRPSDRRWPEHALRIAEQDYANRIVVSARGAERSSAAGILRFHG